VILDNQSTDHTQEICSAYTQRDKRILYVRDTASRISHDAANHLATFITGEFCMLACDDDLWASNFLSTLVGYLQANPNVGLAFSNACYVDVEGNRGTQRLLSTRHLYAQSDSPLANVWCYLWQRRVVPTLFGVYRSEAYLAALPFDTFDDTIADVDNLFLIKLMARTRVHGLDEVLFWYRNKYRGIDPALGVETSVERGWLASWWFDTKHQWRFVRKIDDVLSESPLARGAKAALRVRSYYAFVVKITLLRFRSLLGRLLVRLRLREGAPVKKDVHFKVRSAALRATGYNPLERNNARKQAP